MVDSTLQFASSSFSGIQWNPVESSRIQWNPVEFRGVQWNPVESTIPGGEKRTHPNANIRVVCSHSVLRVGSRFVDTLCLEMLIPFVPYV